MRQRQPLGRASAGGMSQIEDKGGGSRWPGRGRTWPAIAVGPVMGFDSLSWKSSDATGRSGMKWDKILRHACFDTVSFPCLPCQIPSLPNVPLHT